MTERSRARRGALAICCLDLLRIGRANASITGTVLNDPHPCLAKCNVSRAAVTYWSDSARPRCVVAAGTEKGVRYGEYSTESIRSAKR